MPDNTPFRFAVERNYGTKREHIDTGSDDPEWAEAVLADVSRWLPKAKSYRLVRVKLPWTSRPLAHAYSPMTAPILLD